MRRFVTSSAIAEMSRTLTSLFAALTGAGRLPDLKGNLEQDRRPAAVPALLLDVLQPARHCARARRSWLAVGGGHAPHRRTNDFGAPHRWRSANFARQVIPA